MIFITQFFTLIFIIFLISSNIKSIHNNTNETLISSNDNNESNNSLLHSLLNKIKTKQQLKSRLPNIHEPLRNLKFGKLNFLHTTDTHGWYLGHLNQKQYSADWGDFYSFHSNLLNSLNNDEKDLLLIDTGDRHDGNGLSDLSNPNGLLSSKIFKYLNYDLITIGNHELYNENISTFEFEYLVPYYGEKFISTNVKYLNNNNEWVVFGNNTYRYFQTNINNYNILSFSFLFDFKMANNRIQVLPINEIINSDWFLNILSNYSKNFDVDLIIIFGHLPVNHNWNELYQLHKIIRFYFPKIYIQYFGGHSHIRDFSILDNLSTGLQSGRYCETIGFLSIDQLPNDSNFNDYNINNNIYRKYIDFNIHSFMNHNNKSNIENFNTDKGLKISKNLAIISSKLKLDETYGIVPQNYYMFAADYLNNDSKSLLKFLENDVLTQLVPKICHENDNYNDNELESNTLHDNDNNRIILINTGSIRYDLYKGDFNKNSLFTVSPFKNKWKILSSIPNDFALKIKDILNNGDYIIDNKQLQSNYQIYMNNNKLQENLDHKPISNDHIKPRKPISYGYTTVDDLDNLGDDTIHKQIPSFYVPNVIQSFESSIDNSNNTDIVYYDFIEPFIFQALREIIQDENEFNNLPKSKYYNDCSEDFNLGQLLKKFAIENWN